MLKAPKGKLKEIIKDADISIQNVLKKYVKKCQKHAICYKYINYGIRDKFKDWNTWKTR